MVSFNRTILAGNITRDPELKFTNSGVAVCNFGVAVNRVRSKDGDEVDFFDVSAWRQLGETIANYKKKGDPILIEGKLQYRSWEAQDGSKRSKIEVVADNVQFLARSQGNGEAGGQGNAQGIAQGGGAATDEDEYSDIPF
jgi:single-strand DNA-binding protein